MKPQNPFSTENARRDPLHPPLSDKIACIVGLGGAADIALDLLRSGVSKFHLYDPDVLESGNLVRHACGSRYVGMNKAEATRAMLEEYAGIPLSGIHTGKDVFDSDSEFEQAVRNSDIVIVGTDTDASRAYVNDLVVESATKAVFVSMFENGCGGEVFAFRPEECCYGCLMLHQERHEFLERYEKTARKPDCSSVRDVRSMPGLGVDQRFLSAMASRISLDLLLEDQNHSLPEIGSNWIVFSVSGISEILEEPFSSLRYRMRRHADCRCGR